MPRVTAAHEEATRQRILEAASQVFADKGFHDASIQDVVRASGLSVGAIYTYFRSKDDLVRASCLTMIADTADALLAGLPGAGSVRDTIGAAIDTWSTEAVRKHGGPAFLSQAWASAAEEPGLRDMLVRRRERLVTVATVLLREAIVRGEIRRGVDVDSLAHGFIAMMDGFMLQAVEEGERFDAATARRRLRAFVDLVYAPGESAGT